MIREGVGASTGGGEDGDECGAEGGRKRRGCDMTENGDGVEGEWVQEVVRLLDMAVIMAGAPERGEMIEGLLAALQDFVELQERDGSARKKRRRKGVETFPTEGKSVPEIQYPIPSCSALSMEGFERHLETGQPLVIRDVMGHWPAVCERPWKSVGYLLGKTFGGRRLVPVEVGRSYTDEGWGQEIMTFGEFMDRYLLHEPLPTSDGQDLESGDGMPIAYLAQHDLLSQISSLRADISIPDYCYTNPPPPAPGTPLISKPPQPVLEEPLLNAWFGPAETVSPLHTDPYHNIFCQVVGKKYVRLYSPEESGRLYPRGVDAGSGVDMSNTSEVDVEASVGKVKVGERFPLFKGAAYVECVLGEGECLYVPIGWWHYVRSLSVSFSVSFWWN